MRSAIILASFSAVGGMALKFRSRNTTCTVRARGAPAAALVGRSPPQGAAVGRGQTAGRIMARARRSAPAAGLATARLQLRLLTVDDAPLFVRLFENDWDAVKQTGRMPYPVTELAMRDWIALHATGSSRTFLMIRKEDGAALGGVGFGGVGKVHELGYALGRAYWGHGYATEGVLAMVEHARTLGLKALEAFTFIENPASARVLTKAGFTDLGIARRNYPKRGGLRSVRHHLKRL
jgi:[ribosomal protein S5]-alanine N-acetyltransferase